MFSSAQSSSLPAPRRNEESAWFTEEILPHERGLRAYLASRFPASSADDLVQETFLRVMRAREEGPIRFPRAFLFTTARNLAIDLHRIATRHPTDALEACDAIPDPPQTTSAEHHARDNELALLEEAISSLPPRCREIIVLKKIHGYSYDEIGKKLSISPNTISAHVFTGVSRIREFMRVRARS